MSRKVPDSVPSVKARGKTAKSSKGAVGVPEPVRLGNGDSSDSSHGHDKGQGEAKPAVEHKFPC